MRGQVGAQARRHITHNLRAQAPAVSDHRLVVVTAGGSSVSVGRLLPARILPRIERRGTLVCNGRENSPSPAPPPGLMVVACGGVQLTSLPAVVATPQALCSAPQLRIDHGSCAELGTGGRKHLLPRRAATGAIATAAALSGPGRGQRPSSRLLSAAYATAAAVLALAGW
jgi:hypothetical protein